MNIIQITSILLYIGICVINFVNGKKHKKEIIEELQNKYVVICDAGSSGTRGWLLYLDSSNGREEVVIMNGLKINPGLSSFGSNPSRAGPYLEPVIKTALEMVPMQSRTNTYVFVLATAGMRTLTEANQAQVYDQVYDYFNNNEYGRKSLYGAHLNREYLVTITGQEEGFYGMLAVNFLKGRIGAIGHFENSLRSVAVSASNPPAWPKFPLRIENNMGAEPAYGSLDLGGQSTQILYDPLPPEDALQEPKDIYAHSFLGLGQNAIKEKLNARVIADYNGNEVAVPCGCYPSGFVVDPQLKDGITIVGTGDGAECRKLLHAVLQHEKPTNCDGCTFDGEYLPAIAGELVAMSGFYYSTDCIRTLFLTFQSNVPAEEFLGPKAPLETLQSVVKRFEASWPKPTIAELREAIDAYCSFKWEAIQKYWFGGAHPQSTNEKLALRCFEVNYILELLSFGYGIQDDDRRITYAAKINGNGVQWALGAFLVVNSMIINVEDHGEQKLPALRGNTHVMNRLVDEHHGDTSISSGGSKFFFWIVFLISLFWLTKKLGIHRKIVVGVRSKLKRSNPESFNAIFAKRKGSESCTPGGFDAV